MAAAFVFDQQRSEEQTRLTAAAERVTLRAQQSAAAARKPILPPLEEHRWARTDIKLQAPWLPALRAVEDATQQPIYLLALSIDPASGGIRIEGEAPSLDHALAYAQMLDESHVLAPAQLQAHEPLAETAGGRTDVRFSLVTRWVRAR